MRSAISDAIGAPAREFWGEGPTSVRVFDPDLLFMVFVLADGPAGGR